MKQSGFLLTVLSAVLLSSPLYADGICKELEQNARGADYVPNIDIHGKTVVPADISGNQSNTFLNDPIIIPLNIDIAQRYNINIPDFADMETTILSVKIFNDGRVMIGQEDVTQKIRTYCENEQKKRDQQGQSNGHPPTDAVASIDEKKDKIEGQYPDQ